MGLDKRPIGIFDSGLGGLTAVRKLIELLPGEDVIYLGDTGRVPYGGRSRETIVRYALEDAAFLLRWDVKAIVVACGTVTSNAIGEVTAACPVPVTGIVESTAAKAVRCTRNGRIGILATSATIRSGAFGRAVLRRLPGAFVSEKACPLLVPLVEDGRIRPDEPLLVLASREYLTPLREQGVDTLILGCTHYPIIARALSDAIGPGVTLVDSGEETVLAAAAELAAQGLLSDQTSGGQQSYFVTDSTAGFAEVASLFLGGDVRGSVTRVNIGT